MEAEPAREQRAHRSVVSYVRRSPRMTPAQRTWIETYSHRWVIPVEPGDLQTSVGPQPTLDLADIFGREAPLVIEIGSGHGESIVAAATAQPDTNFLGFEVFEASIAATLGKISDAGLSNVRLIAADAISGLIHLIEDASVTEILIFFPDPWQKKRHHKRRLVSPGFLDLVSQKLIDGGILRLATDWDSYAQAMRDHLGADPRFALIDEQRFHLRPLTKFESRGIAAGRTIQDMAYQLKARS